MPVRRRSRPMPLFIPKVSKQHTPATNAVSTGEKTKGRKRQIVTDTLSCLLGVVVHWANLVDTTMGLWPAIFATEVYPTIKRFCADKGYRCTFINDAYGLLNCCVDISANIKSSKRWVVERTFAWLNNEAMIKFFHIHTLLNRLWTHPLKREFHADDAALTAYLFNTVNIQRLHIMSLQQELSKR